MSTSIAVAYAAFSFFVFYQQLHVKNFGGASQPFLLALSASALLSMLFGLAFLVYFGFKVSWLGAAGLFLISFAVKMLWFGIEAKLGIRHLAPFISISGFVGLPLLGYFLWHSVST